MTQNSSWHPVALPQEFCMCSDGDLAKVHHKCRSCQQKVHSPLCGHTDEAAFGGPVIICFKCQDPSEHILNSVSEGNQDNDVAFLKSVVASKKNTENYNNARLPGAGAGKKCNCEVFLDLRNDKYELQCIFCDGYWYETSGWFDSLWSRAIYKCEEHEDQV